MGQKQSSLATEDFNQLQGKEAVRLQVASYLSRPGDQCDTIFASTKHSCDYHEESLARNVKERSSPFSFDNVEALKNDIHLYLSRLGDDHDTIFASTKLSCDHHQAHLGQAFLDVAPTTAKLHAAASGLKLKL